MYALVLATALALSVGPAAASTSPGLVGTYCRVMEEAASPHRLRETMRQMKAAGIDFILPTAKGTSDKVNWDSKVAPEELIGDRAYIERIVKYAHAEGLKVYPVVCVCTEGGDKEANALL